MTCQLVNEKKNLCWEKASTHFNLNAISHLDFCYCQFLFVTHFYDKALSSSCCCLSLVMLLAARYCGPFLLYNFFLWSNEMLVKLLSGAIAARKYRRHSVRWPIDNPYFLCFVCFVSILLWHFCFHRQYLLLLVFSLFFSFHFMPAPTYRKCKWCTVVYYSACLTDCLLSTMRSLSSQFATSFRANT